MGCCVGRRSASPGLIAARQAAKERFFAALGDDEAAIRYQALAERSPENREEYLLRAQESRESAKRNRTGRV